MIFKVEGQCPNCAQKGKKIARDAMIHHVDDIAFLRDEFDYFVCKNSHCDTVYFSIVSEFDVHQLNKEVGYKNSSTQKANICYCYNINKEELHTNTAGIIETKMEEYPCACEQRNPYGTCCLGEIKKLLKEK